MSYDVVKEGEIKDLVQATRGKGDEGGSHESKEPHYMWIKQRRAKS